MAAYRTTPVFDEATLPAALRREHRTRLGVRGVVEVIEGRLRLVFLDPSHEAIVTPGHNVVVLPDQAHDAEPIGAMRMCRTFHDSPPG
ncbi:DUF1971 domain-containing protein [Roseomonas sp. CECT 9278]|uniref:DUF1971 domain-containing protein n=1 Tax=Roseomonas sp. CECT 9278 TaxID=2845823 RepID=UPI001E2FA99C|nr:DUF1971 domain-containing protein [Roseomonas sp. CECT 9278]CAH0302586.1 hypothetical protein ROS9278_04606 [Roseomonas sp. CECT 9278]